MTESANTRINNLYEKIAIGLLSVIIAWGQLQYQESKDRVKDLETKVQTLYLEKVSRGDLRDLEDRINSRIESMKSDLLARLDLYFGKLDKK